MTFNASAIRVGFVSGAEPGERGPDKGVAPEQEDPGRVDLGNAPRQRERCQWP